MFLFCIYGAWGWYLLLLIIPRSSSRLYKACCDCVLYKNWKITDCSETQTVLSLSVQFSFIYMARLTVYTVTKQLTEIQM